LKSASTLRSQIESALSARIPVALSPRRKVEPSRIPCGLAAVDQLLQGGLPIGTLTEFVGAENSGRTSMALAYIAAVTQADSVCAWIDVADALDPESVAANGVDLERLLWVRCGPSPQPSLDVGRSVPRRTKESASQLRHTGGGSPHPRSEGRDMPQAISAMLHAHGGLYDKQIRREKKSIGTPGMPNRPLSPRSEDREEQINSDRRPPRRGDNLAIIPCCAEPLPRRTPSQPSEEQLFVKPSESFDTGARAASKPWQALDQALRSTDLLLQSGGFGAIVLDLGSTPPEFAWRIPLATWFRFRAACERTRISLVLLTQHPCARSSAELVVRLQPGSIEAQSKVMTGIRYCAATERSRSHENAAHVIPIRKPPQSEHPGQWRSEAAWIQTK
jgi:recombination protein RecA